jgi:hypothetical protein
MPSRVSFASGPGARQKVRYVSMKGSQTSPPGIGCSLSSLLFFRVRVAFVVGDSCDLTPSMYKKLLVDIQPWYGDHSNIGVLR